MQKKYIVRLTNEERESLRSVIKKLKGSSQKVRRAQVLLKADADGPGWTDARIAEAFDCRTKTVENIRQRLVRDGFESALNGKQRESPPRAKLLDGEQEAKLIAMRLGSPPKGFANWTLRLLAQRVVQLEIVDSASARSQGTAGGGVGCAKLVSFSGPRCKTLRPTSLDCMDLGCPLWPPFSPHSATSPPPATKRLESR